MDAALKVAAVGGIFMVWYKITIEAFNFAWHIISISPEKETLKAISKVMCAECKQFFVDKPDEDQTYVCFSCAGFKAVCGYCQELYDDDEYHLIHGTHLCHNCR